MQTQTTDNAIASPARGSWESIAHELQQEGFHCRTAMEWDKGFEEMLAQLRQRIDKHGVETVLKSCAWAFLGFHPAFRD